MAALYVPIHSMFVSTQFFPHSLFLHGGTLQAQFGCASVQELGKYMTLRMVQDLSILGLSVTLVEQATWLHSVFLFPACSSSSESSFAWSRSALGRALGMLLGVLTCGDLPVVALPCVCAKDPELLPGLMPSLSFPRSCATIAIVLLSRVHPDVAVHCFEGRLSALV